LIDIRGVDDEKLSPRVYARSLRKRMTDAELILWARLRRNAMDGHRFRRQHPIGPYIADFVCLPIRLVVEVDGATHSSDDERKHDARRDAWLRHRGFRMLRFGNREIYGNLDGVLDTIWRAVHAGRSCHTRNPQ
jgi:very-short-patch-repair endonuclease